MQYLDFWNFSFQNVWALFLTAKLFYFYWNFSKNLFAKKISGHHVKMIIRLFAKDAKRMFLLGRGMRGSLRLAAAMLSAIFFPDVLPFLERKVYFRKSLAHHCRGSAHCRHFEALPPFWRGLSPFWRGLPPFWRCRSSSIKRILMNISFWRNRFLFCLLVYNFVYVCSFNYRGS